MAQVIIMPKQGLQMTEGTITEWLFNEGDLVQEGESLFEMETDKLSITIDATTSGTLLKIIHDKGEVVPITQPIAVIGEPGEDISEILQTLNVIISPTASGAEPSAAVIQKPLESLEKNDVVSPSHGQYASPRAKMTAENMQIDYHTISGSGPEGMVIERDVLAYSQIDLPKASPLAQKVAALNNMDLNQITGTGLRDKIMSQDVLAAIAAKVEARNSKTSRGEKLIALTGMRKVVASRMKESLQEMAQANHRITVDMTEAVKLHEQLKKADVKVSYNDIVLRCAAKALTEFPMMNTSWSDDGILIKEYVNLGVAVSVGDGLIVPVIRDADLMSLPELASCSVELAKKAKDNTLQLDEYTGGTFTVSNLGMFDIDGFTAVINPPEAGILAVGKLAKQPVVIGDEIVIRSMMQLSLTYDHRIIDGAPAAEFLRRIKTLLENPGLLI
ncbi:MAG: 2-oxo acid dehydrogenase subunit E2 [Acidaminobacter sp.]|uniref:dihydrolipoamide acetyltransferase family protein n=1 Tax=Acidaminobacter sp. TaxID=1872102 RepID=UPI00137F493F|nr:dihydrolipoamide acetyltransferase family protein [Acidaminobacter sp.]MZQ98993.1 2-oxo acid dehydrogenase subunit E2 [Acidaminobacter sp.]